MSMTKAISWMFFAALAAYSAVLLAIEATTSQDFVRHYFSDIDGGRPFFAINTSLSMLLLVGGAVLLAFAATLQKSAPAMAKCFLLSQTGMLCFLAFDDRFQLHEALAYRIGIADHFIMAGWAAMEVGLILALARLDRISFQSFAFVFAGGCCFVVMMLFDAVMPHDLFMRLSIEDLAKSWAAALFFAASWSLARFHLGLADGAKSLADVMTKHRKRPIRKDLSAVS